MPYQVNAEVFSGYLAFQWSPRSPIQRRFRSSSLRDRHRENSCGSLDLVGDLLDHPEIAAFAKIWNALDESFHHEARPTWTRAGRNKRSPNL
jgi:hypothetical protein